MAAAGEIVECARYGELDELAELINLKSEGNEVNYVGSMGNTALHMACANGHLDCVELLLKSGAEYKTNDNGNTPLHWAVLNKHIDITKVLLTKCESADVLHKNSFGKSALTEAFGVGIADLTQLLLEHKSADKLETDAEKKPDAAPTPTPNANEEGNNNDNTDSTPTTDTPEVQEAPKVSTDATSAAESKVVQSYIYDFNFSSDKIPGPSVKVREVATDWSGEIFSGSKTASDDTTGMQVWATSLVFSRWIVELQENPETAFDAKQVIELGAGTGLPGLTTLAYSKATKVTLTDLFKHTLNNLRFNVASNLKESTTRTYAEVEVKKLDWTDLSTVEPGSFDIVIGSDLVYDDDAADLVITVVDHILTKDGVFYLAAGGKRQGVTKLVEKLAAVGFSVASKDAPMAFLENPLSSGDDNELELHFNELEENTFTLHAVTRATK
eukprot:m.126570 g.126570  ORF g.126570 m.126570 type:complete len:442 (+) comp29209_c0_seq2:117-1442(+)